jgi:Spy/CpxP family protein refolding chaperone
MKNNYKFWIAVSFLAVFAAGIVGGVVLERHLLDQKPKRSHRTSREPSREAGNRFFDKMVEELSLTPEQQDQMRDIFKNSEERIKNLRGEMDKRFHELRVQFVEEIKSILTEEQIQKYDAMIEEHRARRKAQAEKRKEQEKQKEEEEKGG